MEDWTLGYVADIDYTYGYYAELQPIRAELLLASNGIKCPKFATACELGFGQGISTNIHAAATDIEWYGTDFNPVQAGLAQEMAEAAGSGANLTDESFEEFCNRSDLPDFDFICLHGIWSWVNDENRKIIIDFIRRKLRVGGVLYVSYNTLPGWSSFAPVRHIMNRHADLIGAQGHGILSRMDGALDFTKKLLDLNPAYLRGSPTVKKRLEGLIEQNRHYLAHEYFTHDWHPMYFSEVADWLLPAKLDYACSAHPLDQIDSINLTKEHQEFLNELPDKMLKQSVRDFIVNQQFRRDYWIKGLRKNSLTDSENRLRNLRVMLRIPKEDCSLKVNASLGEATLDEKVYQPIFDALADHKPKTLDQLNKELGIPLNILVQTMVVSSSNLQMVVVQDEETIEKVKPSTQKYNRYVCHAALDGEEIRQLASPVTGGAVSMARIQMMFLNSIFEGKKTPKEWAEDTWECLRIRKQALTKEGKTIETDEESVKHLEEQANDFKKKGVPLLKAQQIL